MRILVTGHRGYLGHAIVERLLECGHAVTGLDTDLFRGCVYPPGAAETGPDCDTIDRDIRDVTAAELSGFDGLVHLAGLSNDPLGEMDHALTHEINHAASVHLAQCARDAGVRKLVLASSCSVYGAADDTMLAESAPFAPATAYAVSKLAMEQDIAAMTCRSFSPIFLRSGTVYGVTPKLRFDLVVNNLVAWAMSTGEVFLKSDGTAWRPLIHVSDVARAFVGVMEADEEATRGEAFNVALPDGNLQIRDVADSIVARIPGTRVTFSGEANRDKRNYRVSGEKLARLLGDDWAVMSLADGIDELAAAFGASPVTAEQFEGPQYQRLAHLKAGIDSGLLTPDLRWMRREQAAE